MNVIKMQMPDLGNQWCAFKSPAEALAAVNDAIANEIDSGGRINIVLTSEEMTEEQYDALGEFAGW